MAFCSKYPYTLGLQSIKTEANRITILNVCETKTVIARMPEHTHTNFCEQLEKITLLCIAGVTTIQENITEKHYTKEEGVYVENNAEPSLKTQSGQKCR